MNPKLQHKKANWPAAKAHVEKVFKTKTRDEWCAIMEYSDICFAPVLTMSEAFEHPHAKARDAYLNIGGVIQPAPAPRFSHTPAAVPATPPEVGADTAQVLKELGVDAEALLKAGVVVDRSDV